MADLSLTIGAKDEASPAFRKVADAARGMGKEVETSGTQAAKGGESLAAGVFKAQVAFEALSKAAGIAVDFLKGGIKDYIEQEKANARLAAAVHQLGYDVGTLAPALQAQAEAFEQSTLIQAENVEQVQQLLLRYGVAPRDIQKTTAAILDYSVATGENATSSAKQLAQALIGGGEKMNAFGISVQRSGDRTKDLHSIVDKLADQFGGSARAATEGFAGDIGRLEKAQSDLGKAFGHFIADVETKYHIIESLTEAVKGATIALSGDDPVERQQRKAELTKLIASHEAHVNELLKERARLDPGDKRNKSALAKNESQLQHQTQMLQKYRIELKGIEDKITGETKAALEQHAAASETGASKVAAATNTGTDKIVKSLNFRSRRLEEAFQQTIDTIKAGAISMSADAVQKEAEDAQRALDQEIDAMIAQMKKSEARADAEWKIAIGQQQGRIGQLSIATAKTAQDKGSDAMQSAGMALGNAFVSGLDQSLSQMEGGGEMDIGALIASLVPALVTVGLIAATGGAAAPFAPLVGAAAGMLVKHAMASQGGGGKYHSGGEVDHRPRFHSGGGLASDEVEAVLQTGEMVFSRGDVARHGGPQQLDQMRRGGGGGMNVYVSTLDSQSFSQFMGARGGTGLTRTLATNRGEFAQYARRAGLKVS